MVPHDAPDGPRLPPSALLVDMGNTLVHWDPRHLYRRLLGDEAAVDAFLETVCTTAWNHRQDLGRPFAEAVAELQQEHPEHRELIAAFWERWDEMVPGPVAGMPELMEEVRSAGTPVYVFTNSSAETYPRVTARFGFLDRLDGAFVSGAHGVGKPDPAAYRLACRMFSLEPESTLFIDDLPANVEAARRVGLRALVFRSAARLRTELAGAGIPLARGARPGR